MKMNSCINGTITRDATVRHDTSGLPRTLIPEGPDNSEIINRQHDNFLRQIGWTDEASNACSEPAVSETAVPETESIKLPGKPVIQADSDNLEGPVNPGQATPPDGSGQTETNSQATRKRGRPRKDS